MSSKRQHKPAMLNMNIKRAKLLTQDEKVSVSEWLKATETESSATVKTITLQQRTAKGVLLLNCNEKPDKAANITRQGLALHRTEKEVFAKFEEQRQVGIIMPPDQICELARTIHTEIMNTEAQQRLFKTGLKLNGDIEIRSHFDASEKWFQQFCTRYNVPWRPHVPEKKIKLITAQVPVAVTKKTALVSFARKLEDNKKIVPAEKTKLASPSIAQNKPLLKTRPVTQLLTECKKAARQFIRDFQEFITEGSYLPQQVFNAAEMFLHYKLLPQCTKIYKKDRFIKGHDHLSLLFCGNATGDFVVKSMYLHHTWSPKIQDESLLPVYIPKTPANIHKEFIRAEHFFEWLQNCFIPEVRDFLQAMNLPAKALLLIDPALLQGHNELPVSAEDNFVEFLYFPEKTASLLQPLSMSVMPTFACNYLRRLLSAMMANTFVNYQRSLKNLWDQFPMADSLSMIQQSLEEINAACWNSGWATIWKKVACKPFDQNLITAAIARIAAIGRQIPEDGFIDMTSADIEKHLKSNASLLPAFRVFDSAKNHLDWLDSDNDSDIDETIKDLDKNPFLLRKDIVDFEEDEFIEEPLSQPAHEIMFESVTVACDPEQKYDFKSEQNSPTPSTRSRLLSTSECETPNTPEFDLSLCKSDVSSLTPSDTYTQDKDSDTSSSVLTSNCFLTEPSTWNSQLNECPKEELTAFRSELSICNSDLSSPTLSETFMQDIDSDCSSSVLTANCFLTEPSTWNSQLNECPKEELTAFRSEVKSCVVNRIDNLSQTLKSIPEKPDGVQAIRSLHQKLDMVVNELNILKSECVEIDKKAGQSIPKIPPKTMELFVDPFETAATFRKFEENLQKCSKLQERLTHFFCSKLNEDSDLDKNIEKIWRSTLTDNAAYEFVWKGRRNNGKQPVKDFKFSQLLKTLFIERHKGLSTDFDVICGKIFNAAHDRWRKQQRYRIEQKKS